MCVNMYKASNPLTSPGHLSHRYTNYLEVVYRLQASEQNCKT